MATRLLFAHAWLEKKSWGVALPMTQLLLPQYEERVQQGEEVCHFYGHQVCVSSKGLWEGRGEGGANGLTRMEAAEKASCPTQLGYGRGRGGGGGGG